MPETSMSREPVSSLGSLGGVAEKWFTENGDVPPAHDDAGAGPAQSGAGVGRRLDGQQRGRAACRRRDD